MEASAMDKETQDILQGVLKNLELLSAQNAVQKTISGTPDAQSIFGVGGIFSNFGLDSAVINLSLSPRGMSRVLPAYGTIYTNPIYPYITGFESDDAAEVNGVCDDAPGGVIEVGHQTAAFGRIARASQEMEVNTLMQVLNGHLTTDLRVLGSILGEGHQLLTQQANQSGDWIRSMVKTQMVIVGVLFQRKLSPMLFTGDPANNSAGGGYKEFPGLDILISTGKVDAISGVTMPALDSDVKDFGYNDIDSADPSILQYVSMMHYYLGHVADRTGLSPVEWVLAMRPQLFFELTAIWPCQYLTNRCANSAGTNVAVMNDQTNVDMRDQMRNGSFLWVNGVQVPVVTDDGIWEDSVTTDGHLNPGEFSSDIYFIPIRFQGAVPAIYWEYLDYTQAMAEVANLEGKQFWATDNGRYMWTMQQLNYCFKIQGKIEPRVILRTPQLAGRIQNVKYSPLQHLRDWNEDSFYFKKGGKEEYSTPPTYYSDWNRPQ